MHGIPSIGFLSLTVSCTQSIKRAQKRLKAAGLDRPLWENEVPKLHQNVRFAGEDIKVEEKVLEKGTLLRPGHISVLAAFGYDNVPIIKAPTVAVISTGSELVEVQSALNAGKIRDSNSHMLQALAMTENCNVKRLGIAHDDPEALKYILLEALNSDVVLISGGVSVGTC